MKVVTDPETGVTTCELYKQDRNVLANAKTVFEKMAFHLRGTPQGGAAELLCKGIAEMLSSTTKGQEAQSGKPPATNAEARP